MTRKTSRSKMLLVLLIPMTIAALSCTTVPALFATPTPTVTPTPTSTPTPTLTPTPTPSPTPQGGGEWIVFASRPNADANSDIYVMRPDGSGLRRLTNGPGNNWSPDLSPDGRRVVFVSDRDRNKQLYLINIDGSGLTRLTYTGDNYDPAWAPDGQQIAFVSARSGTQRTEIWTARIGDRGLELSTLTLVTYDNYDDRDPSWSPDGSRIVYASFREDGGYNLFIIPASGGQPTQLTNTRDWDRSPRWSPNGRFIAFTRWATEAITDNRSFWVGESWDNRMAIIYIDNWELLDLPGSIYLIGIGGEGLYRLTNETSENWAPCWSPDGQWIAFVSDRGGDYELYIMNTNGGLVTPLTTSDSLDSMPSWR